MRAYVISLLLFALAVSALAAGPEADRARERALDHYKAGQRALFSEEFEKAEAEFKEAIRLDAVLVPAHYGLGQTYMAMKEYPKAVAAYSGCRDAFHQEQADALMGVIEWEKRLSDQIRAMEDQVRILQSGRVQGGTGGAQTAQLTAQRLEEQINLLKGRRQTGPKQAEPTPASISVALGSAHFRTGALADAEREYRAALDVDSELGEAHNNLAVVYMLMGRLEHAQKEIDLAEKAGFKVSPGLRQDVKKRMELR